MLKKIKNWSVKKLGGYTQDEYDYAYWTEHFPRPKPEPLDVVKLSWCESVDISFGGIPDKYLKGRICDMIAGKLEPFITWKEEYAGRDRKRITGILRVVEPSKDERETYDEYFENDF